MDSYMFFVAVVLGLAVVILAIAFYRFSSARKDLLNGMRAEAEIRLRQSCSEEQVAQIMESLQNYGDSKALQLAIDLYLYYDDPDSLQKSIEAIGTAPSDNMMLRTRYLMGKYDDQTTFQKVLHRNVWIGQTEGELRDSQGEPASIDENVLETQTKEVWNYDPRGSQGSRKRITLENGEVANWDINDSKD
jgi:hypothetical protein